MTALADQLGAFLLKHLPNERGASRHTVDAYAYTFQLFVNFVATATKRRPHQLKIEDLSADRVLDFLDHVEEVRGNAIRTRNLRLAGIKSFFRFLEWRTPECLAQVKQIQAIPKKAHQKGHVDFLNREEIEAILDAPSRSSRWGLRDRAMLLLTYGAGLRVSESVNLDVKDINPPAFDQVHVLAKGRQLRNLPLWKETRAVYREWLNARPAVDDPALFVNARGSRMTRFGFGQRLAVHAKEAARQVPSLQSKKVTPHVLRHSCAMHTLEATGDIRRVALWLGHASLESTKIYLHVDPAEKMDILGATTPPSVKKGQFKGVSDRLLRVLREARRK